MKHSNQQFDLKHQYKLFLQRMSLDENKMHPQQKIQIKQAFYGACGQLLIMFRDEVGAIESEEDATEVMKDLLNQVGDYWLSQSKSQN